MLARITKYADIHLGRLSLSLPGYVTADQMKCCTLNYTLDDTELDKKYMVE